MMPVPRAAHKLALSNTDLRFCWVFILFAILPESIVSDKIARMKVRISTALFAVALATSLYAQDVVRTADPIKRGMKLTDIPRTVKVMENVYTYEDYHAGDEPFTTTNMFVVTSEGVILADAQGNPAMTKGLVAAIRKITAKISIAVRSTPSGSAPSRPPP